MEAVIDGSPVHFLNSFRVIFPNYSNQDRTIPPLLIENRLGFSPQQKPLETFCPVFSMTNFSTDWATTSLTKCPSKKRKGLSTFEVIPYYKYRVIANFVKISTRKLNLLFGRVFGLKLVSISHIPSSAIACGLTQCSSFFWYVLVFAALKLSVIFVIKVFFLMRRKCSNCDDNWSSNFGQIC